MSGEIQETGGGGGVLRGGGQLRRSWDPRQQGGQCGQPRGVSGGVSAEGGLSGKLACDWIFFSFNSLLSLASTGPGTLQPLPGSRPPAGSSLRPPRKGEGRGQRTR